jgi:hypothetical protein
MKAMGRLHVLALGASLVSFAAPAVSCSITRTNPGRTAEERMAERPDVRRVIGRYHIERVDPESFARAGTIHGRLTTLRGTWLDIAQPVREAWIDCLVYQLPLADASGTFYLARWPHGGEYELLDWSGDYLPAAARTPPGDQPGEKGRH